MNQENKNIKLVREAEGLNQTDFAISLGIKQGSYSDIERGKVGISGEILKVLIMKYRISPIWLFENKGEMRLSDVQLKGNPNGNLKGNLNTHLNKKKDDLVAIQSDDGIPLLPISAMAGWASGDMQILRDDIKAFYNIPELNNRADFMIRISGSSMYPKYSSGDVIACRFIKEITFLQWGKVYVMDTTQGALVKRLFPGETKDKILCKSDNEAYPPFEITYSDIRAIAVVVGVVRFE